GIEDGRGEWCDRDRHAQPQDDHRQQKGRAVEAVRSRNAEEPEACGHDEGSDDERPSRADAIDETAAPFREQAEYDGERQESSSRGGRRITVNLDEQERQEEHHSTQGSVEQESEQVDAAETPGSEEFEGHHWRAAAPLEGYEAEQEEHTRSHRHEHRGVPPAAMRCGDQPVSE